MNFGQYISHLRTEKGLSQEKLGKLAGISGATISMLESGTRTDMKLSNFKGLAKALGVSPLKLFLAFDGKNPDLIEESGIDPEEAEIILQEALEKIRNSKRSHQVGRVETDQRSSPKKPSNP